MDSCRTLLLYRALRRRRSTVGSRRFGGKFQTGFFRKIKLLPGRIYHRGGGQTVILGADRDRFPLRGAPSIPDGGQVNALIKGHVLNPGDARREKQRAAGAQGRVENQGFAVCRVEYPFYIAVERIAVADRYVDQVGAGGKGETSDLGDGFRNLNRGHGLAAHQRLRGN